MVDTFTQGAVLGSNAYGVLGMAREGQVAEASGYALLSPAEGSGDVRSAGAYALAKGAATGGAATHAAAYALAAPARTQGVTSAAHAYGILMPAYPPEEEYYEASVSFVENRLPEVISYGASGGPGFKTSLFELDSGYVSATSVWDQIKGRYELVCTDMTPEELSLLENFFYKSRGRAHGFRMKDWLDYQVADQNIAVGDGAKTDFQFFKRYTSGRHYIDRFVRRLVPGKVQGLNVDGGELIENLDYYINYDRGTLQFTVPPARGAVVNVSYFEYDVPVRFDTDFLEISASNHLSFSVSNLPLVEIIA